MKLKKYLNLISLKALFYILFLLINENKCNLNAEIDQTSETKEIRDTLKIKNNGNNGASRITKRGATANKGHLWNDGIIPYEISSEFQKHEISLIKKAMKQWEHFTCLQFVERDDYQHYIRFTRLECGCCSFIGKQNIGAQYVSIGPNCTTLGNILHELGHVIGFWHEHSRPDRDQYIHINTANIPPGHENFFRRMTETEINSLNETYDYKSIMHYEKSHILQLVTRPGRKIPKIGQRKKLSNGDINQANLLYNCPVCGTTLNGSYGTFDTLLEASSDEMGLNCEWRIHAAKNEKIILNITGFHLRRSDDCSDNYVRVRDGYSHESPIIGHYCGTKRIPTILTSTSNYLLVECHKSSEGLIYYGVDANYRTICGGDIYLNQHGYREIESPHYPENYEPNKKCIWRIYAPKDHQVILEFESLDIESSKNCRKDYIEFREGNNSNSDLISRHCGSTLPTEVIQSVGHQLFIKFVSDSSNEASGFSATISAEIDECKTNNHGCDHNCVNTLIGYYCSCRVGYDLHQDGKTCIYSVNTQMTSLTGIIYSPYFPDEYPKNIDYTWRILVPEGLNIIIRFSFFNLEDKDALGVCNDYVEITNLDNEYQLYEDGIFCGSEIPPPILIQGNKAEILFSTNKEMQKSGFSASYQTKPDKCLNNNGGCQHICQNTIDSHICLCYNDFTLDDNGLTCTRQLPKAIEEKVPCQKDHSVILKS